MPPLSTPSPNATPLCVISFSVFPSFKNAPSVTLLNAVATPMAANVNPPSPLPRLNDPRPSQLRPVFAFPRILPLFSDIFFRVLVCSSRSLLALVSCSADCLICSLVAFTNASSSLSISLFSFFNSSNISLAVISSAKSGILMLLPSGIITSAIFFLYQ